MAPWLYETRNYVLNFESLQVQFDFLGLYYLEIKKEGGCFLVTILRQCEVLSNLLHMRYK